MSKKTDLWILTATHAVNDFYTGAVAALLPFFVLERHYDYAAAAGITLAATSLSSVAQPVFGYLSDRFRMRWLIIAGMCVAALGVSVSGLVSSSYWWTCIVIAVSGIGVAAYHPAATMEAKNTGGGSNSSMSLFSVGGNVGVALAPTAVVLTVGTFGLGATTYLAVPAVLITAVYLLRARHIVRRPTSVPATQSASGPAVALPRDDWRAFGFLTAVLAFWSIAYVATSSFISLYSIERFGITPGTASIALSVFPAAGAVGTLGGGWLADRYRRLTVIRSGYLAAAASMLLIVLAPAPAVVVVATGLLGIALFVPFAPQITLSHSYLPNRVGMASGLTLGLTLSLGGIVSPLLGSLADHTSIRTALTLVTALLAVAFALSFVLYERTGRVADLLPDAEPVAAEHT
ncbi:MFS transporter [Nakamurella silvestris]|nr:MFS transporter [Nakamurella silvestris]